MRKYKIKLSEILTNVEDIFDKNPNIIFNLICNNGNAKYEEKLISNLNYFGAKHISREISLYDYGLMSGSSHEELSKKGFCNGENYYEINFDMLDFGDEKEID